MQKLQTTSNHQEHNTPFTATFGANPKKGSIDSVSHTILNITGYSSQYFMREGIPAFLEIISQKDRRALFHLIMSMQRSALNTGSVGLSIKHFKGYWVLVDLVVLTLDLDPNGCAKEIIGVLKASTSFDWLGGKHQTLSSHLTYRVGNYQKVKISRREYQVLQLIAHGNSSKMIADKLFISVHTAARHRSNLLEKFQAKNTAELVWTASKQYWL